MDGRRALDRRARRAAARRRGDGGRPGDAARGRRARRSPCATTPTRDASARRRLFSVYGAIPTYQRILATGDATDPAEVCVVGTESQVRPGSRRSATPASPTSRPPTFAVGDDRTASLRRTHELLASLAPELLDQPRFWTLSDTACGRRTAPTPWPSVGVRSPALPSHGDRGEPGVVEGLDFGRRRRRATGAPAGAARAPARSRRPARGTRTPSTASAPNASITPSATRAARARGSLRGSPAASPG